ncbi:MAG: GTP-binding protein [Pseudomonadota bacterium]
MKKSGKMAVFLVSGFLGAGKTTLISHLLASRIEGLGKMAIIVNEVGEIGIDGTLLSGHDVDMVEITSGCICCTMKGDFSRALKEIHDRVAPDFLIVETTGVAQPGDILDLFIAPPVDEYARIRSLVTVISSEMFKAREVFGPFYDNQIRYADKLILNKADLVSPESLEEIKASLHQMNPEAFVFPAQYCAVDPSLLFRGDSPVPKAQKRGHSEPVHLDEWGFQTFSFEDSRPMHRERLNEFLKSLPPTLFRLKGWVRFPDGSALLDFSGGRFRIAPIDDSRSTAFTFVGRNCNKTQILDALKQCRMDKTSAEK